MTLHLRQIHNVDAFPILIRNSATFPYKCSLSFQYKLTNLVEQFYATNFLTYYIVGSVKYPSYEDIITTRIFFVV